MTTTVITGTTNGIGLATTEALAQRNHDLIMLCRNQEASKSLATHLTKKTNNPKIRSIHCDLGSLESITCAVDKLKQEVNHIDLLINNAGIISPREQFSEDGFELTMAVNHLGPLFLTKALQELLIGGQVINLASKAHFFCATKELFLDNNLQSHAPYSAFKTYARSKFANILTSFYFANLHEGNIASHCLHPGIIGTNIFPTHNWLSKALNRIWKTIGPSPSHGAKTTLHLALSDPRSLTTGQYWENSKPVKASRDSYDRKLQKRLWERSAEMTGITI